MFVMLLGAEILSASRFSGVWPSGSSPGRTRICCTRTSDVAMCSPPPRSMIPGDGAVCPAIVMFGFLMLRSPPIRIVPDTSNTHTRGPLALTQARSDPSPLSFRFVTLYTLPPRPAGVSIPKPEAFGRTGTAFASMGTRDAAPRIAAAMLLRSEPCRGAERFIACLSDMEIISSIVFVSNCIVTLSAKRVSNTP